VLSSIVDTQDCGIAPGSVEGSLSRGLRPAAVVKRDIRGIQGRGIPRISIK
jgi:hypothetical protein